MSDIIPQIHCHRCDTFYPQTEEFFRRNRHGNLSSPCRKCVAATKRAYRKANPDKVAADKKRDYEKRKEAIREYHKQWYQSNIEQQRAYKKQYSLDHAEEARERASIWYANNKKRASKSNASRYQRQKEIIKARVREYAKRHPDKIRMYSKTRTQNRRARVLAAEGSFTVKDIRIAYSSQRGRCWHCFKHVDKKFHADHLVPLDKGGTNWPNNIVVSCSNCNLSKGAKYCYQWNGRLF